MAEPLIDATGDIIDGDTGLPLLFPRDANHSPSSFLLGHEVGSSLLKFATFTSDGRVRVDAAITVDNVDIGDVNIRVKDITEADILVSGGTNPDATTRFLYNQDQRMTFLAIPGALDTNPVDRVAREVGRVLGSDSLFVTESTATVDANTNMRPVNGDFAIRRYRIKLFLARNTGANDARVTVLGSLDDGATYNLTIANDLRVRAGETLEVDEDRALTNIRILARSFSAGSPTTIQTSGYEMGT